MNQPHESQTLTSGSILGDVAFGHFIGVLFEDLLD